MNLVARIADTLSVGANQTAGFPGDFVEVAMPLTAREGKGPASSADSGNLIAHTLRAEGHDASEDGTGRGTPLVADTLRSHPRAGSNSLGAIAFNWQSGGDCRLRPSESGTDALHVGQVPAVGFALNQRREGRVGQQTDALHEPSGTQLTGAITETGVRRLTPVECERLQGLPDQWTKYGRRDDGTVYELKDAPRYRMLGNAVTVNVAEWIARRIARADQPTSNRERPGREGEVAS